MKRLTHLPLIAGAVISLFPFYFMIIAATHRTEDLFASPPPLLPGDRFGENLHRLEETVGFSQVAFNSIAIAVVYTVLSAALSAMCGYGLAKYRFRGRGLILAVILATMMIPFQVLLVPLFEMMATFGWMDSYQAVIVPFLANAFGIFLMRQAFLDFPTELIEAGRIDGSGELRIFYRIVLPAARPQLAAVVIFTFITQWSNFLWPLLMLNSEDKYTIPVALSTMIGQTKVDYSGLLLGSFAATLPIMLVFLIFQKQFISGLLGGSVKG
ncbi:carbohydrate ABC transporter permease [Stackebrandtia nassauensis]|uniref:Binding-protein-dependent transport systems inner membrane component n=1 Tax=Stackebrandtia nassauensis (strain DSM 44728 / CIP 108903 / NRRL B-16338 / NBRC 102104 / LLR-40K-21) TaxID=446470 RepID=D3Q7E0_STANL|nr:carbohydrate ABC transporter permease [Stackebrandtia nassauensis]ADD42411.1 binding-protein-dependent transport systems inner membrane component [Stackebrandtia nassauensis DSM 44728]